MKTELTVRGAHVPDTLRERIERGIGKLERYLHGHAEAQVVISQTGAEPTAARYLVEVVVRNRIGTFAAEDESHDLSGTVNSVMSKLQTQLQRAHDKRVTSRRRGGESAPDMA